LLEDIVVKIMNYYCHIYSLSLNSVD